MEMTGLHHVSSLTALAANNLDFYTRVLGLRLVKKTVNQDDVTSYHLYYADNIGHPGTTVTFFDIPQIAQNRPGTSSISRIALRVTGADALKWWADRFDEMQVNHEGIATVNGRAALNFTDPEGQRLALVDDSGALISGGTPWEKSATPSPKAIKGLDAVTLTVRNLEPTALALEQVMGFRVAGTYNAPEGPEREITVFTTGQGGPGAEVHVDQRPDLPRERLGQGGVHHVAYRIPNDQEHLAWLDRLESVGLRTSGVVDRFYFKSIYFREPNGILFELATDGPGFIDNEEDADHLGQTLALPPFLENRRDFIEQSLIPLDTASAANK